MVNTDTSSSNNSDISSNHSDVINHDSSHNNANPIQQNLPAPPPDNLFGLALPEGGELGGPQSSHRSSEDGHNDDEQSPPFGLQVLAAHILRVLEYNQKQKKSIRLAGYHALARG